MDAFLFVSFHFSRGWYGNHERFEMTGGVSRISRSALDWWKPLHGSCLRWDVWHPEVCISLPLNRCVKAPEGMGAPFTMNTSTAETENFVYRPPLENADAVPSLHQKKKIQQLSLNCCAAVSSNECFPRATCCWLGWRWMANGISTSTVVVASWLSFSSYGSFGTSILWPLRFQLCRVCHRPKLRRWNHGLSRLLLW